MQGGEWSEKNRIKTGVKYQYFVEEKFTFFNDFIIFELL